MYTVSKAPSKIVAKTRRGIVARNCISLVVFLFGSF